MLPLFFLLLPSFGFAGHDYGQALSKSIMFFEAQRSGVLPHNQRVSWRSHSGLQDGKASGVGDGNTDHKCWQRPEDMTTDRHAYKVDPSNPGSDLAGETAAAMAAASIVFRRSNPAYSHELLRHAYELFDFADKYRGKYDSSITVAQKYYRSISGYNDELLWAAAWLYQASNNQYYLDYLGRNGDSMGGTGWQMTEFSWDVKYPGVQTLVAKFLMQGKAGAHAPVFEKYLQKSEYFMCSCLGKGSHNVQKTPGGLIYRQRWNNLQFVTSASFLATVYSDYLVSSGRNLRCDSGNVPSSELLSFAKSQANPSFVSCFGGYNTWFSSKRSNTNLLTGAIVGGPDAYDDFADERKNYEQTEPATYNNAPLLGVLARLSGGHGGYNQLLPVVPAPRPVVVPAPRPIVTKPAPRPVITKPHSSPKPRITPTPASKSGPISVEQKVTNSWVSKGRTYYRYSTIVTNKSTKNLKSLNLSISKLYGPIWGLTKSGDSYTFPAWVSSLSAGKSIEFVYIHSTTPADVSVANYVLA
ncbi:hypothetical protein TSUD_71620 [Trifolium subterraneum]|uniref:Endoglucanase n=1 Tax=Trifolium subterraneum TaxID=3900 RepID=A0A2Z6MJ23_TRISU|nr:hypothetical protein TSUD_71620 [Trifolium subterraneum]